MKKKGVLRIAIIGSLVDTDLVLGEMLLRQGVIVDIFRSPQKTIPDLTISFFQNLTQGNIKVFNNPIQLFILLRKYDFIYTATSALFFHLKALSFLYPFFIRLGWPKYMVVCSGSNITERAAEKSLGGILERFSLRHSFCNVLNNYPHAVKNSIMFDLGNWILLPFVYAVETADVQHLDKGEYNKSETLIFFHPSHLDWGQEDNSCNRNSTKGNDRFIKAFAKACKKGLNARCIILDRGSDKENARKLIAQLDSEEFFIWKPELSRERYHEELKKCDVVVDQFDAGGLGGIAVEAISMGKPVIGYVNAACNSLLFGQDFPVLNCHTEAEIEDCILRCEDKQYLKSLATEAKKFINQYYDPQVLGMKYLFYAELAVGKTNRDYGWEKDPYSG